MVERHAFFLIISHLWLRNYYFRIENCFVENFKLVIKLRRRFAIKKEESNWRNKFVEDKKRNKIHIRSHNLNKVYQFLSYDQIFVKSIKSPSDRISFNYILNCNEN